MPTDVNEPVPDPPVLPDGFQWIRPMIDPDGYLCVPVRTTSVDGPTVIGEFLDSFDPALLADEAITKYPEHDPASAILLVLKGAAGGGH